MTYETFREACRRHINPSRADETVLKHYHTLGFTPREVATMYGAIAQVPNSPPLRHKLLQLKARPHA